MRMGLGVSSIMEPNSSVAVKNIIYIMNDHATVDHANKIQKKRSNKPPEYDN